MCVSFKSVDKEIIYVNFKLCQVCVCKVCVMCALVGMKMCTLTK